MNFHPVNLTPAAYNNSKTSLTGKSSLTLEHKKELFNVSFIVINTISVPILRLESRKCKIYHAYLQRRIKEKVVSI